MTLHHAALQAALEASGHQCVLETFDQLPSTSEYLAQVPLASAANGGNDAYIVACDWQTQGNGRRGKTWDTAPGNITFSVRTVAPVEPAKLMGLSLVTGVSVAQALSDVCELDVQLKWPNDVIVQDRKLCGLLTEVQSKQGSDASTVITGIGINTLESDAVKAMGIGGVSLQEVLSEPPQREQIIAAVVGALITNYQHFYQQGWPAFSAQWASRDYLLGKTVTLHGEQEQQAIVQGIDDQGALLVSDKNNSETRAVFSGEVSVRIN